MSLAIKAARLGGGLGAEVAWRSGSLLAAPGTQAWAQKPGPMAALPGVQRFGGPMMYGRGVGPMGDPGFFDFIGKAVKGVTGIVGNLGIPIVSGVAKTIHNVLPGGAPAPQYPQIPQAPMMPAPGIGGAIQRFVPGGATGMVPAQKPGSDCGGGYRTNKSGYYLQSGQYVAPGTKCVKKRRMDPLNPRALSSSMRRLKSFNNAADRASKQLARMAGSARRRTAPRATSRRGRSCGCK